MYWLRWHITSKTLQGHRIKLKRKKEKKRKTKQQNRRQSVVAGRQQLYLQYNHDRLIIVERRPKKYSLQLATERRQRRCIPDRQRQAVPRTCRSHWEGTVTECWTSSGRYHQHGWVSRAQMLNILYQRAVLKWAVHCCWWLQNYL